MHAWHREFAAGVGATLSACTPEGEGAASDAVFRGLLEWKPQRRAAKADKQVARWADGVNAKDLYLPVVTVQELEIGVRLTERRDPGQGAIFRTWMDQGAHQQRFQAVLERAL